MTKMFKYINLPSIKISSNTSQLVKISSSKVVKPQEGVLIWTLPMNMVNMTPFEGSIQHALFGRMHDIVQKLKLHVAETVLLNN